MKDKIIQSFTIKGLFGLHDVHIPFEHDVMILIGENGMGKTQIMNLLYYVLSRKFNNLQKNNFESISLKFTKEQELEMTKEDATYLSYEFNRMDSQYSMQKIRLAKNRDFINRNLNGCEVLYLPTYRRVEEKATNLMGLNGNLREHLKTNTLFNFGEMDDVEDSFLRIAKRIAPLSKEGLAKMSSEILNEMISSDSITETNFLDTINEKDIDIILGRVGDSIDENAKKKIRHIVATKEIEDKALSSLYFLKKLISAYDAQRELDNSIRQFRDICNKYFINKTLVYDEKNIDIYIKIDQNNQRIHLNDLSFGEKQIVSIFSKIYLSSPDSKFIILIDEPELSLSIFWQRDFLPDIYNSGKVKFLLAATHSPFTFENELDRYAVALSEYMKPIATTKVEQPV